MRTKILIAVAISIILSLSYLLHKSESHVDDLRESLLRVQGSLSQCTISSESLREHIDRQNNAIEEIQSLAENRQRKYNELLNREPEIRYIELKSNECEDIKTVIDDIRNIGY